MKVQHEHCYVIVAIPRYSNNRVISLLVSYDNVVLMVLNCFLVLDEMFELLEKQADLEEFTDWLSSMVIQCVVKVTVTQ